MQHGPSQPLQGPALQLDELQMMSLHMLEVHASADADVAGQEPTIVADGELCMLRLHHKRLGADNGKLAGMTANMASVLPAIGYANCSRIQMLAIQVAMTLAGCCSKTG